MRTGTSLSSMSTLRRGGMLEDLAPYIVVGLLALAARAA